MHDNLQRLYTYEPLRISILLYHHGNRQKNKHCLWKLHAELIKYGIDAVKSLWKSHFWHVELITKYGMDAFMVYGKLHS